MITRRQSAFYESLTRRNLLQKCYIFVALLNATAAERPSIVARRSGLEAGQTYYGGKAELAK